MHARQQIRNAVVAAVTGLTTTGASVFKSRARALEDSALPALFVYTQDEEAIYHTSTPRLVERDLQVMVEAAAKAVTGFDDLIDQISVEIEVAMIGNAGLTSLLKNLVLKSTKIQVSGEGDQTMAGLRLEYSAQYFVRENDPQSII
jgi:hypothetical protein